MNTDELFFFNSKGINLNLHKDATGTARGAMFLPAVSKGLYASEKILVLEKTQAGFGFPAMQGGESLEFVFEDESEADIINLFSFDGSLCPPEDTTALEYREYNCPELVKSDKAFLTPSDAVKNYGEVNICFCNENAPDATFMRVLTIYADTIADGRKKIAEIEVFCESVEEDTRLKAVSANLGYGIFENDLTAFRDTDIKESLPDWAYINLKRKEIILEGHNIYPYIGSYTGLLNALKFFGYSDLTIREWWKNINPDSVNYLDHILASTYSLTGQEKVVTPSGTPVSLPNKNYKKTNRIALCWEVNRYDTGHYQKTSQYTLPPQVEVYAYTVEEVMIKLYSLKRKLEREFLPVNVNIRDIIGEVCSVAGLVASHHATATTICYVQTGNKCGFSVDTDYAYIEDLRPFMTFPVGGVNMAGEVTLADIAGLSLSDYDTDFNTYPAPVSGNPVAGAGGFPMASGTHDLGDRTAYPDSWFAGECLDKAGHFEGGGPIETHSADSAGGLYSVNRTSPDFCFQWTYYKSSTAMRDNFYLAHFSRYFPNLTFDSVRANSLRAVSRSLPDDENAVCGAVVYLRCGCDDASWDSGERFTWDDLAVASWESCRLYINNVARVQWVAVCEEDGKVYADITGEMLKGYGDIAIVLPKVGTYSVLMRTWDWHNNISETYKASCVVVLPKNVEISGWWCNTESDASVNSLGSATYDSLDRANYAGHYAFAQDTMSQLSARDSYGEQRSLGAYVYDNMADCVWNDTKGLRWRDAALTSDVAGRIVVSGFTAGERAGLAGKMLNIITKDGRHFAVRLEHDDINALADQLNALRETTGVIGEVLSLFEFQQYTPTTYPGHEPQLVGMAKEISNADDVVAVCRVCDASEVSRAVDGEIVYDASINEGGNFLPSQYGNPSWDAIDTLSAFKTLPRYTSVTLDYTKSKIISKRNPRWRVASDNGFLLESQEKILHYVFSAPGCYSVELELDDRNGNTYKGGRRMFAVK